MSKAAVLGGTGVVGAGGAALIGAHQLGAFESYGDDYVGTTTAQLISYNGKCLDRTFGKGWSIPSTLSAPSTTPSLTLDTSSTPKGCLALNWNKHQQSTNVWGGNFRFVWSMSQGNDGFVVYLSGDADTTDPSKMKMKFGGVAYVFKNQNGWKATNKLEMQKDKNEIDNDKMSELFPTLAGTFYLNGDSNSSSSLNFLDNSKKKIQEVGSDKLYRKYLSWEWKSGENEASSSSNTYPFTNQDKWWEHFFDKTKLNIPELVKNLKGKWEKVQTSS